MRKSDKKMENQLIITLTEVCDTALKNFTGFEWLTHLVNYNNFPKSLKIICVFDTNENLSRFISSNSTHALGKLIHTKFFDIGIDIKSITSHISYDTEEDCQKNNNGKWADRLK